jgi:fructokinase
MADRKLYGAIEFGGTKIVLAIGDSNGTIVLQEVIPTQAPGLVMPRIKAFFTRSNRSLVGLGVGAFGPVVVDTDAPDYGRLLVTNKPGWSGFDLVGALGDTIGLPIALFTDVGAAAIGEARLGRLRDARLGVYLTVGTGIGGAILLDGNVLPGALHPEMGHIALLRHPDDPVQSLCQFHANCAEGLAAGPAIIARFGEPLNRFANAGKEHMLIADYLGQLCANLVLTISPHRIVIGGGVGQTPGLLPLVGNSMLLHLGGYAQQHASGEDFLAQPELGQNAGIVGALIGASQACRL